MLANGVHSGKSKPRHKPSWNKMKESNQTKTAAILASVTIILLMLVTLSTHALGQNIDAQTGTSTQSDHETIPNLSRSLEDNKNDNEDYSQYTCDKIFLHTQPSTPERCHFAQTCNANEGLFASFAFCQTFHLPLSTWCYILSPFLLVWLVLLFRMLGSTAEDFFSPSLEMFSVQLGLPPRFAGVTLLALGNGAADVSATISAISQNPQKGYLMSLGELTGAGMFVGTVVAGLVIVVADGVKCRGALIRDIIMYLVTLVSVYVFFARGEIGVGAIRFFFWLYIAFVIAVLAADVYHKYVVLPKIALRQSESGNEIDDEGMIAMTDETDNSPLPFSDMQEDEDPMAVALTTPLQPAVGHNQGTGSVAISAMDKVVGAFSNYDTDEVDLEESDANDNSEVQLEVLQEGDYTPVTSYTPLTENEGVDGDVNVVSGSAQSGVASWSNALMVNKEEIKNHFVVYSRDIWESEENNIFDKVFMTFELPFTALRKLSVPIPCDGYYCRGLVAASLACTPLWIGTYAMIQYDLNLFLFGGFPYVEIATIIAATLALLVMKFAPVGDAKMPLKASVPIALLGFIVAATWIDIIADQLVQLLTFLGVICRIPGSIMGLTVLAWGNSMGDMSANMTMARKGLANMAITACFAGPVFNILIGLSGGFTKLNTITGQQTAKVILTPSIEVGLWFLFANCALVLVSGLLVNKGRIPKGYGYVAFILYIIYICTSLGVQMFNPE